VCSKNNTCSLHHQISNLTILTNKLKNLLKIMKLSITFILILFVFTAFSQDVITQKNKLELKTKILEVGQTELKYKKFDNLEGPTFTIAKSEILMVRYANGTIDIFDEPVVIPVVPPVPPVVVQVPIVTQVPVVTSTATNNSATDLCEQGIQDSKTNYKGQNSGAGWIGVLAVINPIPSLILAAICSSSEPKDQNLSYRDYNLMKDNGYNRCYKDQAKKTKKKKIWTNFGIGAGAWLIVLGALNYG
jgi:hypothetical protein